MPRTDPRTTMNVSLPRSLKTWLDAQVREGGYGTASELIRHLIRDARQRRDALENSLVAAIEEGSAGPMTDADWDAVRQYGRRKAAKLRSGTITRRRSA